MTVIATGEVPPSRRSRSRPLAAVTAVLALAALAALVALWRSAQPTVQTTTVVSTPSPRSISVTDCPVELSCVARPPRAEVVAAVRTAFPRATSVEAWRVVGDDNRTYAEHAEVLLPPGLSIGVSARCLRDDARVPDRTAANSTAASFPVSIVVGGGPGCSVAVTLVSPTSSADIAAANVLAHKAILQIRT